MCFSIGGATRRWLAHSAHEVSATGITPVAKWYRRFAGGYRKEKPGTICVPGSSIIGCQVPTALLLLQRLHVIHDIGEFLSCHGLLQVSGHEADLLFDQFFDF